MSIKNYLQEFKHEIELVAPYRHILHGYSEEIFVESCVAYATFIKPLVWSDLERLNEIRVLRVNLQMKYKLSNETH